MRNTAKNIAQSVGRAFARMNIAPAAGAPALLPHNRDYRERHKWGRTAGLTHSPSPPAPGRRSYKHTKITKPWNTRSEGAHLKAERVEKSWEAVAPITATNAFKTFVEPVTSEDELPTLMDQLNALEDALLGTLLPQAPKPELQVA
eukprot:CAMPEP_0174919334 /NCGR_PEP_ID=MMETSP1355-20121228/3603_1 /TAXON_ID=464990 /ORGANISM="Hemiselmis tepida, Strain CCMP443" /LENGTH=145 /DNA_ID=CAMNT_0016164557 /DNA_START=91 /DNA_END=528 /DNA_ORIENTATION=-